MREEELSRKLTIDEAVKLDFTVRCGFSRKGLDAFMARRGSKNRTGVIVSESRNKECYRIRWDDTNYISVYHKSFIVPIFDSPE